MNVCSKCGSRIQYYYEFKTIKLNDRVVKKEKVEYFCESCNTEYKIENDKFVVKEK